MKRILLPGILFVLLINLQSFGTVIFRMKNSAAQTGTQITVPVKVAGFTNVMSAQGTIQFDQTKLQFVSLQDYSALPMVIGDFGTSQTANGIITFAWIQSAMAGVTLADSSIIFSIKFNVIGVAGVTTPVSFMNSPTPFEVLDPSTNTIPYTLINGSVHIYSTVSVPETDGVGGFHLFQNQPNPVKDNTRFVFALPEDGQVCFEIYNINGEMLTSFQKEFQAGIRSIEWMAKDANGARPAAGTYYYNIRSGKYTVSGKMLLIR